MFKGIDPEETRDVVVLSDPAIDWKIDPEKPPAEERARIIMTTRQYMETLDVGLLSFKEGVEPTVFTIGVLYYKRRQQIRRDAVIQEGRPSIDGQTMVGRRTDQGMMFAEACRWGIRGWEPAVDHKGNGVEAIVHKRPTKEGIVEHELDEKSLRFLGTLDILDQLGTYVLSMNSITEDERKNSEPPSGVGSSAGAVKSARTPTSEPQGATVRP